MTSGLVSGSHQSETTGNRHLGAICSLTLAERQADFSISLLDSRRCVSVDLLGPDGKASTPRFSVYRNNVIVGMVATLKDAFPATTRLVGEAFFDVMAKTYVVNEPPVSPMMFDYGAGFAKFISRFEPAAGLPFLYDVACIERAWVEAYHASEACPVDASAFCNVQSGELPYLRIELHPSLRLVQSRFPALTIWQMNVAGGTLANVSLDDGAENSLVVRPHTDVEVRSVSNSGAAFVLALARGLCLAESIEEALEIDQGFDLTAALAGLMEAGAFVSFDVSLNVSRDGTSPTSSINAIGSA